MDATDLATDIENRLSDFEKGSGLPLSLDTFHIPSMTSQELAPLACLSSPLLIWRGLLCYRTHRTLKRTSLSPEWIVYAADDYGLSADTAAAANLLTAKGALVSIPGPRPCGELEEQYGSRLAKLSNEARRNYETVASLYGRLRGISHIPVIPRRIVHQVEEGQNTHEVSLRLPVLFNFPATAYDTFSAEYRDDLLRLRHALREIFKHSQQIRRERGVLEVIRELDYQISCLNVVYRTALRKHWLSGLGVVLGLVITGISFVVPPELRPFLLAAGSPATMAGALNWLASDSSPEATVRKSDYYLAWKFQVQQ